MTALSTHAASGAPLISGFDHATDPALLADHFREWTRMQAEMRAFRSDIAQPFGYDLWYLLRHADINAALQDPALFSSRTVQYLGESSQRLLPEELDPPEHTKYRQLLSRPLSPGNVAKMEEAVRERCAVLIDNIQAKGSCDFVTDVALRFPTAVFLHLMGLPVSQAEEFVGLARTVLHTTGDEDPDQAIRGNAALQIVGVLARYLEARKTEPRGDLLTLLSQASIDGAPLSHEDLLAMGFLLYLAGLDTVANVLAYSIRHLAEHPQLRSELTADPERWPSAIEEFLRFYSIATTARVVTSDVEFAGCPMKAGDRVVLPTAAAGRDPELFAHATEFDPNRSANRHVAFGAGPHRCVGAHLARLEMRIFFEEWHRRIPEYAVASGADIREHVGAVAGMKQLPLVWRP